MTTSTPSSVRFVSPLWRKILGAALGVIVAVTVLVFVQRMGLVFWPLPEGLDYRDRAQMIEVIRNMPVGALLWVALSYFTGVLAGAFVALRFARDPWTTTWPALVVEALLLAFGVINLMSLPHPVWFWIVSLASFPLGAFAAIWLARRFAPAVK